MTTPARVFGAVILQPRKPWAEGRRAGTPDTIGRVAGHDRRLIAAALLVAAVCGVGFLILAASVNGVGPVGFDQPVIAFVQALPVPIGVWWLITALGGPVLVAIDVLVVVVMVARREYVLASLFGGTLIFVTLGIDHAKDFVARPRPDDPLVAAVGYSFPSGHAFSSTVSYGLLAYIAWRSDLPLGVRRIILASAVMLVALIGCSRIALGVHYPTDVVAGWLGGIAVLCLVVAVTTWWSGRGAPRSG